MAPPDRYPKASRSSLARLIRPKSEKKRAAAPIARSRRATEAGSGTEAEKDHVAAHNVKSATCHFIQLEKECCSATRRGFGTFFWSFRGKIFFNRELGFQKSTLGAVDDTNRQLKGCFPVRRRPHS